MPAPIALFVYNRLGHTKQTLEALSKNEISDESEVYIFSDGPKDDNDSKNVSKVREYVRSLKCFKRVNIIEQNINLGLAASIIKGVGQVLEDHNEVIILEDDILPSVFFLRNINHALEFYRNEEQIIAVSGYTFPHRMKLPDTFFLFFPAVWGWATWRRGWRLFEVDGKKLLHSLSENNLYGKLNHNNSYPYKMMLENEVKGLIDSWGIKWYASCVLAKKYTLMFGESLTKNIGHDSSGVHSNFTDVHDVELTEKIFEIKSLMICESKVAQMQFEEYLHRVLYDSHIKLGEVCSERLDLINSLTLAAEERLATINQLNEEVKRLKRLNT